MTEDYERRYVNLRILKSIQEYLKPDKGGKTALYPIKVPNDFLYQMLKLEGPEEVDKLIHHIFTLGLNQWSEELFRSEFGTLEDLEEFIERVKKKKKKQK